MQYRQGRAQQGLADPRQRHAVAAARQHLRLQPRAQMRSSGRAWGAMVNNLIYNPAARAVHYNLIAHEWVGRPYQVGQGHACWQRVPRRPGTSATCRSSASAAWAMWELFPADNPRCGPLRPAAADDRPLRRAPPRSWPCASPTARWLKWLAPQELERVLPLRRRRAGRGRATRWISSSCPTSPRTAAS